MGKHLSKLPINSSTLVEIIRNRAHEQTKQKAYSFLLDGELEEAHLTYGELDCQARSIGFMLQSQGVASGDRALLLYPPGLEYIAAFFGCLYAGVIAVPAYPPRLNRPMPRLEAIVADAQATVALTTTKILTQMEDQWLQAPNLKAMQWLATDSIPKGLEERWQETAVLGSDRLAFLQYTSGSTAAPKGVMVSHGNLIHNQRIIQQAMGHSSKTIFVGWLPLFHDMGLIGNMLQPLYLGIPCILMSPIAFLQRPLRWLQAISQYKATTSGGPNFAYDLCVSKITEEQRATLDLSRWEVAFNGSEPVRAETLERFAATFEDCGFRREAFYPCYGMAETTLIVSGGFKTALPVLQLVQQAALAQNQVVPAEREEIGAQTLVGCGQPLQDLRIVIAHPETAIRCAPDEVGEIWVAGSSVAQGYWNQTEQTEQTFRAYLKDTGVGPFLRTGDLGFLREGELFVTGRLKDLIVIRGRNYYPQDIEWTVEQRHPALQPSNSAAFSIEVAGEERLVVTIEVKRTYLRNLSVAEVIGAIRHAVVEEHELQVYGVLLLKPGSIPKTSSGKIQRHACRSGFLDGSLDIVGSNILRNSYSTDSETKITRQALLAFEPQEQYLQLTSYLREQVAHVLKVAPSQLNCQQPLSTIGLDSLMAIELQNGIETNLGAVLPMASILNGFSIAQLATETLAQLTAPMPAPEVISAPDQEAVTEHPLSYGQQALWFLHQLAPESPAYNIASAVRLHAELDVAALQRSLQTLVDRHPTLRTTFNAWEGKVQPQIHGYLEVCFQHEDASTWSEEFLNNCLVEEAHRPFNLEQGPLLRVSLFTQLTNEHILLLAVHHIVADFWSLAILMDELGVLYQAQKAGTQHALVPLPVQYTDYVRASAKTIAQQSGERLWVYWQKQLAGELPVLNLPTDQPRPPSQSYRGASQPFRLSVDLTQRLKVFSRSHEATLYMTLLAVFQVLLYRYTGQEDILVGSPTTGRSRADWARLVGYFINPVVLRANLSAELTFEAFLSQVRQTVLDAFAHQDYPFALVVERLQPIRDPSRSPLFQVMFVLQKAHLLDEDGLAGFALGESGTRLKLGELELESLALEQQVAQFDLTLIMAEVNGSLSASWQYNTDLFDRTTIARMASHFQTLLEGILANPKQCLSTLPLLNENERSQLLVDWNKTKKIYPQQQCIHQLFEAQVEQTPDAIALVFDQEHLTYQELNARANQLAHHLQELGIVPEKLVGIHLERSLDMVVALLGIFKAGGAYMPLDPTYPHERLAFMLEDAQVSVLLTQDQFIEGLSETKALVVCLNREYEVLAQQSKANLVSKTWTNNLAYVIYTSGSTGKPKGVMNTHDGICNRLLWMQSVYQLTDADRVLQKTPLSFDVSIWEIFWPLLTGASVVIARPGGHQDSAYLVDLTAQQQITTLHFVPSMLQVFLEEQGLERCYSLKQVMCSGEALSLKLQEYFFTRLNAELHNLYGPTEAAIDVTFWACEHVRSQSVVPIGRPIANTQIYLLDTQLQPVPVGVPGELHISGVGLARGYFNRPELTATKFIPNPFSNEPGARLYKSGDLARYRSDGSIEYLGRLDHQVKLRGFRIELEEIDIALSHHPDVQQVVVMAREDISNKKHLVAYIVPHREQAPTSSQLYHFLQAQLPEYMLPTVFVFLETLPLTPNGKVDRRMLPVPTPASLELKEGNAYPRTPIEEVLVGIWMQILDIEQIGIYDNFFAVGGHSLLATRLMSRVRQAFQTDLPLQSLFETPTIAGLAASIEIARRTPKQQNLQAHPIQPITRDTELPLSFAQQRLWFLDQLEPGNPFYNVPAALHLKGHLKVVMLEQSLNEIIRRHEALRTTFSTIEGRAVQVIASTLSLQIPVVDLRMLPKTQQEDEIQRLSLQEAQQSFDLSCDPLVRATLLQQDVEEHILLLTMHHIITDGWSLGVLVRELVTLYKALNAGEPSPLPELPIQYPDFANWQRQWLKGKVLESQIAHWKQRLSDRLPVLELPTDRPRPAVQTFRGAKQTLVLPKPLSKALKALSQQEGVTLFMTLLAAFKTLLYRYTEQEDIVVGSPIANRNCVEIEALIGLFVNTVVLYTNLSPTQRFRELLRQVREVVLEAHTYQDMPFEKLVEELQPDRYRSHSLLFQVAFALQNSSMPTLELSGLVVNVIEIDNKTAKFDLSLDLSEEPEGLKGWFEYNTDLFNPSTIKRMINHFQTLLEGIVANPDAQLLDLPILTQAQQQQLLVEWNSTKAEYPGDVCIHQLFEAQVEQTPDAIAVVFENEQLSYRELNCRANQLANYLQVLGVKAEVCVGICVERSLVMLVGLLGILKAGGAYVPLDPTYPQERLTYMLESSQVSVLLTQQQLVENLTKHQVQVVCLDTDWEAIARSSQLNPISGTTNLNLAYIIYTSGSTGKPKGVGAIHQGVVRLVKGSNYANLTAKEVFLQFAPISFDASTFEIWGCLLNGARLIIFPPTPDSEELGQVIVRSQVTTLWLTSGLFHLMVDQQLEDLKHVRQLLAGGDVLSVSHVQKALLELKDCCLINGYGPTENTTFTCCYPMTAASQLETSVPIGRPIANTLVYVLDRHLQPVPIGVSGEIYISGDGLARGYLNFPDLTAEKFIPNPFSDEPGNRLYKTEDLARYLPNGNLEFLGRSDHQVKIRGFRIELGEIEAVLSQYPAVREAVVTVREDGDKRLVAYVVPDDKKPAPSVDDLRHFLKEQLPEYMMPMAFVLLEAIPLTLHGKVNYRTLPIPSQAHSKLEGAFTGPSTPIEEVVAQIWSRVFGLEQIDIHENFFKLGGHSLLATQIISQLRDAFQIKLPLHSLFTAPTIAELAMVIEDILVEEIEMLTEDEAQRLVEENC